MKISPQFFSLSEFRCRCCGEVQISAALVAYLETLRWAWGAPLIVTSGYRCPAHNAEVGGAAKSRHLLGCAADIKPVDPALVPVLKNLVRATTEHRHGWEVLLHYPSFVHVGVPREERAHRWSGGAIEVSYR